MADTLALSYGHVMSEPATTSRFPIQVLQGIRPVQRRSIARDMIAGITLAALAIPEVMGYTSIAGMPVVTGLYTILVPTAVFALLGSSRHLVVGADSATAAILAAGISGLAAKSSSEYVALAGMVSLFAAGYLIVARIARLGFIADFLSRTVLIGFLTGVGIQVAIGQVPDMLGVPKEGSRPFITLWHALGDLDEASVTTIAVSAAVIAVIVGGEVLAPNLPAALLAVVGMIIASWIWDFADHGITTLGPVPSGLPSISWPGVPASDIDDIASVSFSIFVVILAQSAATSRAYAARYREKFDENVDLIGLGMANVAAGFTGTFVVNGSPTKTQMVDSTGGRSQIATLTMSGIVLLVLLFFTKPLQYMPTAVLAAVVFVIGIELVDVAGMKRVLRFRHDEFLVAAITASTVVFVGVLQGIVLAIVLSLVNHLRLSYKPRNSVITTGLSGEHENRPVSSAAELAPGLVVYRFAHSLYYANANQFSKEVLEVARSATPPVEWFAVEMSAVAEVDISAADMLREVRGELAAAGVSLALCDLADLVRSELDRYGLIDEIGANMVFDGVHDVVRAYAARPVGSAD